MLVCYSQERHRVIELGSAAGDCALYIGAEADGILAVHLRSRTWFNSAYPNEAHPERDDYVRHTAEVWLASTLTKSVPAQKILEALSNNQEPSIDEMLNTVNNFYQGENIMTKKSTTEMKKAKKAALKKSTGKKSASKKSAKKTGSKRTGVCAKVHEIADKLYKKNKDSTRADVLAACKKANINPSTASTQYQKWLTDNFS